MVYFTGKWLEFCRNLFVNNKVFPKIVSRLFVGNGKSYANTKCLGRAQNNWNLFWNFVIFMFRKQKNIWVLFCYVLFSQNIDELWMLCSESWDVCPNTNTNTTIAINLFFWSLILCQAMRLWLAECVAQVAVMVDKVPVSVSMGLCCALC